MKMQYLPDIFLSILTGLLLFLAVPGINLWFAAYLAFALFAFIFARKRLNIVLASFICGFIWYLLSFSWLSVPITEFGNAPDVAGYTVVAICALCGGIFWTAYGITLAKTSSHLLAAIVFITMEIIKGRYFFGGMPWLNVAQTQHNNIIALQVVSIVGEQGLSLLVILIGTYLFKSIYYRTDKDVKIFFSLTAFMFILGGTLYFTNNAQGEKYTARMVQTGIDQNDKWDPRKASYVMEELNQRVLKAHAMPGEYDIMILPETTFTRNPFTYEPIKNIVETISDKPLILGYDRAENNKKLTLYNSVGLIEQGRIIFQYDKIKLAPFGEYFPLEKYLYSIRKFFFGTGPLFTPGNEQVIFAVNNLKIAPMICYEGIFPELWTEAVKNGAGVVALISNDAWFGESIGRSQHLAIERLRAVEFGRYLLRTTQDGISAVVDPKGKLYAFPEKQFHAEDVTFETRNTATIFARLNYTWYALLIVAYAFFLIKKRKNS